MKLNVNLFVLFLLGMCVWNAQGAYVLQLGEFDGLNSEFEQESGIENNAQYYAHAGDYRGKTGLTGAGLLQATPEPLLSVGTMDGMRRALTSGQHTMEIFFMLPEQAMNEPFLLFQTKFISPGSGSSHNLKLSLNGQEIWAKTQVTSATDMIEVVLRPSDFAYSAGANYLTFQRTAGTSTNPWISIDAVHLQAVPEPKVALLTLLGIGALGWTRRRPSAS